MCLPISLKWDNNTDKFPLKNEEEEITRSKTGNRDRVGCILKFNQPISFIFYDTTRFCFVKKTKQLNFQNGNYFPKHSLRR